MTLNPSRTPPEGIGYGIPNPKITIFAITVPVPSTCTSTFNITSNATAPVPAPTVAQLPSSGRVNPSAYVTATGLSARGVATHSAQAEPNTTTQGEVA